MALCSVCASGCAGAARVRAGLCSGVQSRSRTELCLRESKVNENEIQRVLFGRRSLHFCPSFSERPQQIRSHVHACQDKLQESLGCQPWLGECMA